MKIISPGGELDISLTGMEPGEKHLILKGRMGIWDAEGYVDRGEILVLMRMLLRPRILLGLARILLGVNKRKAGQEDPKKLVDKESA